LGAVRADRASYEGKPIAIDGIFLEMAQGSWGGDYDHPMYFYRMAVVSDAKDDTEHTVGCVLGDGMTPAGLRPGDRVHVQGGGTIKNPVDARGIFRVEISGCMISKLGP
jgi:hypothetical protein